MHRALLYFFFSFVVKAVVLLVLVANSKQLGDSCDCNRIFKFYMPGLSG
jgi:hypothetical protein